jgi:hypothetical protein
MFRILTESWNSTPDEAKAQLPAWVEAAPLIRFALT